MGVLLRLPRVTEEVGFAVTLERIIHLPPSSGVRVSSLKEHCQFGQGFAKQFGRQVEGGIFGRDIQVPRGIANDPTELLEEAKNGGVLETHLATLDFFVRNKKFRRSFGSKSFLFSLRGEDKLPYLVQLIDMGDEFGLGLVAYGRGHTYSIRAGTRLVLPAHPKQAPLF